MRVALRQNSKRLLYTATSGFCAQCTAQREAAAGSTTPASAAPPYTCRTDAGSTTLPSCMARATQPVSSCVAHSVTSAACALLLRVRRSLAICSVLCPMSYSRVTTRRLPSSVRPSITSPATTMGCASRTAYHARCLCSSTRRSVALASASTASSGTRLSTEPGTAAGVHDAAQRPRTTPACSMKSTRDALPSGASAHAPRSRATPQSTSGKMTLSSHLRALYIVMFCARRPPRTTAMHHGKQFARSEGAHVTEFSLPHTGCT